MTAADLVELATYLQTSYLTRPLGLVHGQSMRGAPVAPHRTFEASQPVHLLPSLDIGLGP